MSKIIGNTVGTPFNPQKFGSKNDRIMKITVEYDSEEGRYKASRTYTEIFEHITDPFGVKGICFLEFYDEAAEVRIIARENYIDGDKIVFSCHWYNPESDYFEGEGVYYHFAIYTDDTVDVIFGGMNLDIPNRVSQLYNDLGFVRGSEIKSTIENALTTAKESGEFKGDAFTYEDFTEEQLESLKGKDGNDYVLTESDKQEIADMIEIPEDESTKDYTELDNKPKINGVELDGDRTLEELGIVLSNSGEEWEIIQDVTLEEDCIKVKYTTDLNGKPFELKKAIVIVFYEVATAEDKNLTGFGVSFTNTNAAPEWNGPIMCKIKEKATFTVCAEEINQRLYVSNLAVSYNAGMSSTLGYGSHLSHYWSANTLKQNGIYLPMNCLKVGSYAKAMGAGTNIILLGIRKTGGEING